MTEIALPKPIKRECLRSNDSAGDLKRKTEEASDLTTGPGLPAFPYNIFNGSPIQDARIHGISRKRVFKRVTSMYISFDDSIISLLNMLEEESRLPSATPERNVRK